MTALRRPRGGVGLRIKEKKVVFPLKPLTKRKKKKKKKTN